MAWVKTAVVGTLGALASGGAQSIANYLSAHGATVNWPEMLSAAAVGGVVAGITYWMHPPDFKP
jgi:hypothetical protein